MPQVSYREASKIKVLEAPRLNPGTCVICGTSRTDDREYMDLDITIEWYGVVYFCTFCFTEAVNVLGCLTKEQTESLEAENDRLRSRIIDFEAKEAALDDAIQYLRNSHLFDNNDYSNSTSSLTPTDAYVGAVKGLTDGDKSVTNKDGKSSKSSTRKQGSDDVSESGSFSI